MFLIFAGKTLFAYSYDYIAVKSLLDVVSGKVSLTVRRCDSSLIPASWGLMDKRHVDNLVNWYKNRDYDYYLWKKIVFNRNILIQGKVSFKFMENLHCAIIRNRIKYSTK